MFAYVLEALAVLLANRTRSILTIIGLIVGVGAIVGIQVAAAGMAGAVSGIFRGVNPNTFYVYPTSTQQNLTRAELHPSDLDLIESTIPGIVTVIPWSSRQTIVRMRHERVLLGVGGESSKRFSTAPLAAGRTIDDADVANAAPVCVLSQKAYQRLFPDASAPAGVIGESIHIGTRRYEIVGVLDKATVDTAALGFDISNDVAIPYTTYENAYQHGSAYPVLQVLGSDTAKLDDLEQSVRDTLSRTHYGAEFKTFDMGYYTKTISGFFSIVGLMVSAVGAISLVVAGIGIMNIMLVSVTERTREIGVRKAIGAKRSQVLGQFFVESLLLSAAGCFAGMVLGVGLGAIANAAFISRISGVTAPVPWLEVLAIAVGFATIVTIVFGTYPAFRAAKLNPIEALRYE